ncbi:hypothetical protein A6V39_04240 [Candidatus Mycoplasma haematobovis]|uniref:Uncharacterized protein n=1 Tax=Candidatus Mycoplasma haematobovis TaxID=432608 RepID=A0A1A9QDR4_9MOLU|nr:hypothetical protein [Candidatus Mycoplasma haematobovis]OAL10096.1 hypothetical protein A6V39_04240 [Candidatus Mycoplasma haematobovis]
MKIILAPKTRDCILENFCLFFSQKTDVLTEVTLQKITSLFEQNLKTLVISFFSLPENFKNNSNIVWFRLDAFLGIYNIAPQKFKSNFDAIVICEDVNEDLKKFIIQTLRQDDNVFIAIRQNPEDILRIFNESEKEFVFLDFGVGFKGAIRRSKKVLKIDDEISADQETEDDFFSLQEEENDEDEFSFDFKEETNEDQLLVSLEKNNLDQGDPNFDKSLNEETPDFLPDDDEDISGGLF